MVSAHLGGGQHPTVGCCPRGGWVGCAPHPPTRRATSHSGVLPTPQVGRDLLPLSHKPTASVREPFPSMTEATSMSTPATSAITSGPGNTVPYYQDQDGKLLSSYLPPHNFNNDCMQLAFCLCNEFHVCQQNSL